MTFSSSPFLMRATTLAALWLTTLAVPAWADDHGPRVPLLAAYKSECSSCHVAYPVGLLPAASWQRLMTHLPKHFGTDASLDAATTQQISDWLMANGGGRRAAEAPPEDRITKGRWFIREHDEVAADVWKRPCHQERRQLRGLSHAGG